MRNHELPKCPDTVPPELNHWHPILSAHELRREPAAVRLHGTEIVLFRTAAGPIGALANSCPHRRMKLSMGKVVDDRLQCMYHGWTFDCRGAGQSPGTPKLHAEARRYDAERHGVVGWQPGNQVSIFPTFEADGYFHVVICGTRLRP